MKLKTLDCIAIILALLGAINWGLIGLFDFDVVAFIFDDPISIASKIVYGLVGLSGIYSVYLLTKPKLQ